MSKKGNKKQNASNQSQEDQYSTFKTVFSYCILIIVCPVITFFGSKFFFDLPLFNLSVVASNIWSAASAVVALHVALGLYIYRAYFNTETPRSSLQKID